MAGGIAYGYARDHGVVVLDAGPEPRLGLREGADPLALVEARRVLGRAFSIEALAPAAFDRALSEIYAADGLGADPGEFDLPERSHGLDLPTATDLLDATDDAPVIRLINRLLAEAARIGASDVHVEPFDTRLRVRFRVDGVLREALELPARLAPLIVSRIKVMARLDIAEKRVPQDGRISISLGQRPLDVRVSTLPARAGERVVMRLLDKSQADLGLEELGMGPAVEAAYRAALAEPNGVILVCGPTGSGKTTSLYAGLAALNDGERNILTVEDPVEYAVEGVGQTQVNAKVGMTFAAGLRAILRQDPDVVMVGEIRDVETAGIAVQASLTGHLVLSTVHTNDAAGAVLRLRDMGIEPFLLASSLRLILAQRLLRRLCEACAEPVTLDATAAGAVGLAPGTAARRAVGCPACRQTGYAGRIGVHEAIRVDDRMCRLIIEGADEAEVAAAGLDGPNGLARAARDAVARGLTTVEEVLRVTRRTGDADALV